MRPALCLLALLWAMAPVAPASNAAREILELSGVKGGLVAQVGCGDGALAAALHAGDAYLVHALDRSPANVAAARARLRAAGLYGKVTVEQWDGGRLPYADGMVNLLVIEEPRAVPAGEIHRVLAPGGVACLKQAGRWEKVIQPWPKEIDEWTHWQHDAGNNAVAHDTRVGPPQRIQWVCEPLWLRGHEVPSSVGAMVTTRGRLFYALDEGQTGVYALPSRWTLIARDAFNGVLLWKRPLPGWGPALSFGGFGNGFRPRRLVAVGERVYVTLGEDAVLTAIDAATGKTVGTLDAAQGVTDILCTDDLLLAATRPQAAGPPALVAADPTTLKVLWQARVRGLASQTVAVGAGRVFYEAAGEAVALDARTGQEQWRTPAPARQAVGLRPGRDTLVASGRAVYLLGSAGLTALSAGDGKVLWRQPAAPNSKGELFVADGLLWVERGSSIIGFDPATGQRRRTQDAADVFSAGHHLRCYPAKATDRFVITPNRGAEFVSLDSDQHTRNDWVRGNCGLGVVPANGLLYAPACQCFCYAGVLLTGMKALAPGPVTLPAGSTPGRLERGPAYAFAAAMKPPVPSASDWPMYRRVPQRLGTTTAAVPPAARPLWMAALGGRLSPPVAAGGRVYVSDTDGCTVYALNATDGRPAWAFPAGARVDSAPAVYGDLVLFGCADGWVYCLRASDGALAWRCRVAPDERRVVAFGRVESAWPAHGSVLLLNGTVYATAGRSTYLDGGIWVSAMDPRTGKLLHTTRLSTTQAPIRPDEQQEFLEAFEIEGTRSDLLVSDGTYLYLGQIKLDAKLAVQPAPFVKAGAAAETPLDLSSAGYVDPGVFASRLENKKNYEDFTSLGVLRGPMGDRKMGLHVLTTGGFLDDTWFNRTFWMYADNWPGYYIANLAARAGQLLCVDAGATYSVQGYPLRTIHSPTFAPGTKGYLLLADNNSTVPVLHPHSRNRDKGMGYTRSAPPRWFQWVPVRVRAMVAAGQTLFVAGPPDVVDDADPYAAFEGRKGAVLWALSTTDGRKLAELKLTSDPVFDGLIAANGRLYLSNRKGEVVCFGE